MRDLSDLEYFRFHTHPFGPGDETGGPFLVASKIDHAPLTVIVSTGYGWDRVSISRQNRCPNWTEMEQIKRMFFRDNETAMQLHVPPSQHRSLHPYCLHLWRPNDGREIPMPPAEFVAPEVCDDR